MLCRTLCVAALSACLGLSSLAAADIVRESTGQLRAEHDRLELTKFPAENWGKLAAWTNGDALTPAATDGKPILIMTWASWHPASLKALPSVQALAAKYAAQGLIVVGIHDKTGWNEASSTAKSKGLSFPVAHDANGDFRRAIKCDHNPMFYFIDRAGHMRFAAVASGSLDEACSLLVGESREEAADVPRIRQEHQAELARQARKTTDINKTIDLSTLPAVPPGYIQPMAAQYKLVQWPKIDEETAQKYGLMDTQTKKFKEVKLAFTPPAYYPTRPEIQGRALVIYLWHPDIPATHSKIMPQMDELQSKYERDLVVVGAAVTRSVFYPNVQPTPGDDSEALPRLTMKYANFIKSRNFKHTLAPDFAGSITSSLTTGEGFVIPGAIVVSSDGIIRWVGAINSSDFKYAIDTIVAVDPAVRARREADRQFIEAKNR